MLLLRPGQPTGKIAITIKGEFTFPKLACVAEPTRPPPLAPPWCGLRPHYRVSARDDDDHGRAGREMPLFEVTVTFEVWESGSVVCIDYGVAKVQILSMWFAKQKGATLTTATLSLLPLPADSTELFVKYTARGSADIKPTISCTSTLKSPPAPPPLPPRPPPPPPRPPARPPPPPRPHPPPYRAEPHQPKPPRVTATSCHGAKLEWHEPERGDKGLAVLKCAAVLETIADPDPDPGLHPIPTVPCLGPGPFSDPDSDPDPDLGPRPGPDPELGPHCALRLGLPVFRYAVLFSDSSTTHVANGAVEATSYEVGGLQESTACKLIAA